MKLISIFILILTLQMSASVYSQTTTLNLKLKNSTLQELFLQIEKSSNYRFFFNNDEVDVNQRISVDTEEKTVGKILEVVFKDLPYSFKEENNNLILIERKESNPNKTETNSQQGKSVSGKVTDSSGATLPGVSVVVKGTTNGTITDSNGNFSISNVPENATLQFSFVGMKMEEIPVGRKSAVYAVMSEEAIGLEEVVAIGFGVQKKKLITGATLQIKGEDLQKLNTVSPITALQSQSPGIVIAKNSGKPGDDYKINIRGIGTIGNSSPLIIIDDIVGGDLNLINSADIESLDVLKDAASAAIYGARAANGVIIVKTKKGKAGTTRATYDGYYGLQNVAKYNEMLNAQQYVELINESFVNIGMPIPDWAETVPKWNDVQNGWTGTNWMKEFTNTNAPQQNHSLNISGGSEMSNFSLGFSYTSQEGIYGKPVAPKYDRYSFRLNSEHILFKNSAFDVVKFGENLLYNFTDRNHTDLGTSNMYWNDIRAMMGMNPLTPVYKEDGDFAPGIKFDSGAANPIGLYYYNRSQNTNKNHNLRANAYLEIQPIKNLKFRSNFGYSLSAYSYRNYIPTHPSLGGTSQRFSDRVTQSQGSGIGFQLENTIAYKTRIKEAHNIDALIGQSFEKSGLGESVSGSNMNSIFSTFEYAYLDNVKSITPGNTSVSGSPWGRDNISSVFGRINYDYQETYMASIILRADGSSKFAKGKRWGYFPSFAAGWLISNESFMKSSKGIIDYLKLRASWGQNGNQAISPFQYLATYSFGANYFFGTEKNQWISGAYPSILPNEDVSWETSEQINLGIDSRFLNSRLGINIDLYKKTTMDWLVQAPVLATYGTSAPYINGGDIENKGIELALSWNDNAGDFTYGLNANMAFNKNNVTRIANSEGIIEGARDMFSSGWDPVYRTQVGYPIGYFYGYKTAGVFQNQEQIDNYTEAKLNDTRPGDLIFVDKDQNGLIDVKDKTMIGNPNPDMTFGLSFNLGFKGFDFLVAANGVMGNQIASSVHTADSQLQNWPTKLLGRWHGEGTSNRFPRLTAEVNPNYHFFSDVYVEDGDYLRIQNVTLGYDFKKLFPKMILSQARLYVAGQNLFTFSKYYGADPEIGYAQDSWSKGIDLGFYTSPKTFMIGINLKF